MFYPDGDPVGEPRMIYGQTLYDSAVLTEDARVIRGLSIDGDQMKG